MAPMTALLFQAPDVTRAVRARLAAHKEAKQSQAPEDSVPEEANDVLNQQETADLPKKSRRGSRGGKRQDAQDLTKQNQEANQDEQKDEHQQGAGKEELNTENVSSEHGAKRTRKRLHSNVNSEDSANDSGNQNSAQTQEESGTTVRRRRRRSDSSAADEVSAPKGSTRLEAKRQRRKEGREAGRRRHSITESEFLARREAVNRQMLVREHDGLNQIAVIEDSVLVEHYVARHTQTSMVGNVYLGRVQNVLPSMEAAFVDIGKGRNAVLYSGEVNWEAAGLEGKPRKIEDALKSGDTVLVQVTKDPIGHKGARLTGQITLAGRHLVLVPNGTMMGISRKLPETERSRLKKILKQVVPSEHGVIVRTAAEGATEEQIKGDVKRLIKSWKDIDAKSKSSKNAPSLLKGEPELAVRVVRDVFNEDFNSLQVQGENAWNTIWEYVHELSPELEERVTKWEDNRDIFIQYRVDEQLQKAFDRKVFLPSGGSLVIDRTEAMTVIDVNTGKFTGATGGTLEETVTKNNLEAAEEIVRQLRLRDIGGIVVIDFIDMVLEANRDLVLRRLIECLGRDRTRHQVAEVTSLGLVQMTRKRVGQGLVEAFSTTCEACEGRGYISHDHPVEKDEIFDESDSKQLPKRRNENLHPQTFDSEAEEKHAEVKAALANIAAAAAHKHEETHGVNHGAGADETENFRKAAKQNSGAGTDDAAKRPKRQKKRSRKSVHSDSDDANSLLTRQMNSDSGESAEKAVSSAADSADSRVLEAASQTAFTVPEQRESGDQDPESVPKRRRVSSTGTITPASSSAFTIMSFPLSGKSDE
ncbi:Rne/Rng family ribonuclease [Arcanobacterium hippocoleae]